MSKPNLVFLLGFVQSEERINKSQVLIDKYGAKRKFFSCKQTLNYVSYVSEGCKEKISFVAYSGNKEKSLGVFGANGLMDKAQLKELRAQLKETKSVIWHGVLSFESEFGEKYVDNDMAIQLMQKEFPKFFKSAGLNKDNISWYGALHENTMNRHIHFSFFEKEPMRYTSRDNKNLHFSEGHISRVAMDKFKVAVEQRLTSQSLLLKPARKRLMNIAQDILFTVQSNNLHLGRVQKSIVKLIDDLPKTGRIGYDSENMSHLKPQIKSIVYNLTLSNKALYKAFGSFETVVYEKDRATKDILKSQGIDEKYWKHYLVADKTMDDVYRRLGNYVINTAIVFRGKQKKTKSKAVAKRFKKQSVSGLLTYCLRLSGDVEDEAMRVFREHMYRLEEMENDKVMVLEKDNEM